MTNTIIGLLRHGQTDWNVDMRLQGISDIPLNDAGKMQASSATIKLASFNWDIIVSSPLSRAVETAQIINAGLKLASVEIEELLIERSFGEAEGLTYSQWRDNYSSGATAQGAESLELLTRRADELLQRLAERYAGKTVLAVSHGALIRRVIHQVSKGELPAEGERFGNTSLSKLVHVDGIWQLLDYNPASLSS